MGYGFYYVHCILKMQIIYKKGGGGQYGRAVLNTSLSGFINLLIKINNFNIDNI